MALDAALHNTQYYKVRIKGKVEQSWEWRSAPLLHLNVVATEKGAFGSPSTKVANFIYIHTHTPKESETIYQSFTYQIIRIILTS